MKTENIGYHKSNLYLCDASHTQKKHRSTPNIRVYTSCHDIIGLYLFKVLIEMILKFLSASAVLSWFLTQKGKGSNKFFYQNTVKTFREV